MTTMTFGVTCPICGSVVPDESVAYFLNMRAKNFHVVLTCCGRPITVAYVALCTRSITRKMIAAAKGPTQ